MSTKVLSPQARSTARLLTTADELFCAEGVRSVRIDRVIAHAGAAKATLYSAFGSKDGLVRAYLQARHAATAEHMTRQLETHDDTPKERLVGAFEVQGLSFTEPGFRGCAFISASDDTPPGGVVEQAANDYRTWLHDLSLGLARQTGAKDTKSLAQQLVLLHAGVSAWLDRDPSAETAARTVAAAQVDAAVPD